MKPSGAAHDEEVLFQLLAEFDEALATNTSTDRIEHDAADLDAPLAAEWESTKECLMLVERLREGGDLARTLPAATAFSAAALSKPIPKRIGRFQLERELGRGGLGIVYLANDPQLGRKVALKIPRFEALLDDELRERFLREAEAAARLNHPHLVALYEVGEDGSICYLASEFCCGPTLAQWLRARKSPVPLNVAANLIAVLAEAVAHAHSRGVLHRDIKPSNVLLATPDNDAGDELPGVAKLTDFGMAKLLEQDGNDRTRTGAILGTLAYMAPEQLEGRIHDLDARTDVYALGAILYEVLTGVAPFAGKSDVDTLRRVIAGEPVSPRRLRSDVPRDLEAIALMCLAKNPAERYSTARELATDLERFLANQPTAARPLGFTQRVMKWARRRPAFAVLVAFACVSAALLIAGSLWFNQRLTASLRIANDERQRVIEEQATTARLLYASQMRTAQQAWREGNIGWLREILGHYAEGTPHAGLRHFEWYHLNHLVNIPHRTFRGHQGEVYGVAYAPDGRTIVTCGLDGTVRLWDVASGESLAVLRDHATCVNGVDFSPDGDTFVTSSCDNTIKLWSLKERKAVATLTGHSEKVASCVFIEGGKLLVSLSYGSGPEGKREARIWDVATKSMRADWPPADEIIHGLAVGRTGNTLVTFSPGRVAVWKRHEQSWVADLRYNFPNSDPEILLSTDEELVFTISGHRLISTRLRDGVVVSQPPGHSDRIHGIALSPDGDRMATSSADSGIRVFSYPSGKLDQCLLGHVGTAWQVAWAPDGNSLASVGTDGTLRVWDLERACSPRSLRRADKVGAAVQDFAFLRDGEHVNAVYDDSSCEVWNVESGQVAAYEGLPGPRLADTRRLLQKTRFRGCSHPLLPQWDGHASVAPPVYEPGSGRMTRNFYRLVADQSRLVQIAHGQIRIWKTEPLAMAEERPLPPNQQLREVLDISQDGRKFCGIRKDGGFMICDLVDDTSTEVTELASAVGTEFSPKGDRIVVIAGGVREYDVLTGKHVRDFPAPRPLAVCYSADAERIAVASGLGNVTIFDALTGEETLRLEIEAYGELLFSRDRKSLVMNGVPGGGLFCWPGQD